MLPEIILNSHRMVWVERELIDHLVPTPLQRVGTSSTRSG